MPEVAKGAGLKGVWGRAAYDSPTNRQLQNTGQIYETGYIGERVGKREKERKRPRKGKGKNKGEGKQKGKGEKNFSPSPDCDDTIVKMRNQLEICKMKGGREITIDVTTKWFSEMGKLILQDMTGGSAFNERRIEDECAKKAFLIYIQSWLSRKVVDKSLITEKNESEDSLDKNPICKKRENFYLR